MLSISARGSGAGAARYLLVDNDQQQADDYYAREGRGVWRGRGAVALGLADEVAAADFAALASGRSPAGHDLVAGAGDQHRAGWDLTFSCPKSVSVAWALASDEQERRAIEEAHQRAVDGALREIEDRGLVEARRGKGGVEREAAAPVFAVFQHGSSREGDPQLHSHCFLHNCAQRADGSWGGIESREVYRWKMAVGALYRAELAAGLRELGYEVEQDKSSFRLPEVPRDLEAAFSTRRHQIEVALADHGAEGGKAAEVAALSTRREKVVRDPAELIADWRSRAAELGHQLIGPEREAGDPHSLHPLTGGYFEEPPEARGFVDISLQPTASSALEALRELTQQASTVSEPALVAAVAQRAAGSADIARVRALIAELRASPECAILRDAAGRSRFTTREMIELESRLVHSAAARQSEHHAVSRDSLNRIATAHPTLSEEQRAAVEHVTGDAGLSAVQGMAGTGKSYMLGIAREAWQAEGREVIGCALAGKAAAGLESGAGIPSQTLHSLLHDLTKGTKTISQNTVIVLDEAGMVGSRQLSALADRAAEVGAKLVLVGDSRQLQPIDAGAGFRALTQRIGAAELDDIRRQRQQWHRDAVHQLADGEAGQALAAFKERDLLHVGETRADVISEMVSTWWESRDPSRPGESIMLAGTRAEVGHLNFQARERMSDAGLLGPSAEIGEREFCEGDRIICTRNHRDSGLKNGELATLRRLDLDADGIWTATLETDDGRTVVTDMAADFSDPQDRGLRIDYGYAMSVHKSQGITVDRAFVLVSDSMSDREWSYVAASRSREDTHIFADQYMVDELDRTLSRSRQADFSLDHRIVPNAEVANELNRQPIVEVELEI